MVQGLFLLFFAVTMLGKLYLSIRQSQAVLSHRGYVPDDFDKQVTLDEHQKAADYTLAKQRLARYEILFQAALLLVFTLGGGLNLLASLSLKWMNGPISQGVLLIILFSIVNGVLSMPFSLYQTFVIENRFGFNKSTFKMFIVDQIKGTVLGLVIGVPLLYAVIYLMGAMGGAWWLYVWALWLVFSLVLMWAFPKWIAPIFNQFKPLEDESLKSRIEALLSRTGFKSDGVFVMDGSKRSGHGNAYFTGLGKQKRIVFFDTLLESLSEREVEAVLAHELGHFKHKHILKQMFITFGLALLVLYVLGLLMPNIQFYEGLGVQAEFRSHAMALLLFMLVLPLFTFPFSPLSSLMSRKNEFEADRFAAKESSAKDLCSALTKLYRSNAATLTPDAWYSRFYDSHPNASERLAALHPLQELK